MTENILKKIIKNKKKELEKIKEKITQEDLLQEIMKMPANRNFRDIFEYNNFVIIGEIKKKAPSKGVLKTNVNIKKISKIYEEAGIKAISVVTDKKFFDGKIEYIGEVKKHVRLPVLRKDFIIDEYQLYESRANRADAVLLIASILEKKQLTQFIKTTRFLNMTPVVEVHSKDDVKKALNSGVNILGINTRDLRTFKINFNVLKNLLRYIPKDKIVICESGIKKPEDIKNVFIDPVVKGVLIGTTFMEMPPAKIKDFVNKIVRIYEGTLI